MKQSIRSLLLSVLVVLTATLTACDTVLEVGVEPTVTPTPTPTLTPTPSPTTGRLPTVALTAVPTATRTTVPTAITEPSATPEPTPTPRTSEIIFLDETWHQYTNYQLGFSLKVPNRMLSFRGACKWNEKDGDRSFRYDPALVPVRIFENVDSVYIAPEYLHELSGEWKQANGRTCFTECSQVPNSLALLQDPEKPWFSAEMWKIVAAAVHSDDELDAFIKARYGSGCSIREKEASGQDGVYRVRVQGDGKDLPETQCPLNYATVVMYYPEGNKIIAWDLGQAYTFVGAVDYSVTYDQEMVESFRFLTETLAVAPSTIVEEDLVTYTDDEYGFSFRYPASWTLAELPERKMDTGRCADTVVLSQDTLAITIQYLHTSQCCEQVAWCGVAWILEPTYRDQVTIMGNEASRTMLTHLEEPKAVDVSYVDEGADLGLLITLRDSSETAFTAPEMATIPASALVELEQILGSFESK